MDFGDRRATETKLMSKAVVRMTSHAGMVYPQTKTGWFGLWNFFTSLSDAGRPVTLTRDRAKAACFPNEGQAQAFVERANAWADEFWANRV